MKFAIPEISWHNRDPVLSVDFQPKCEEKGPLRLASGGTDSHVLIWYISTTETGGVHLEVAADLTRHQKAVNVVRWAPNGQLLASGDDESIIFVWKQKTDKSDKEPVQNLEQSDEQYKESWVIFKTLRGHMEDVLDLSWSGDSQWLASGSVDNKLLVWEVSRGRYSCILSDHKGFVQGVSWDPKNQYIATASSDRTFRTFDVTSKKVVSRSSKAVLPFPAGHALHETSVRLYHDDTLQTFYRRLHFSPDGLLIAVPAGKIEPEQAKIDTKPMNAVYIYTRYSLKVPMCILPCGEAALVCRWSPARLAPRAGAPPPCVAAPRALLAVGTRRNVLIYDTHQKTPIALISNIHYTRLTDLTWSPDGLTLVASSTDGFCSVITFGKDELGTPLPDQVISEPVPEPMEVQTEEQPLEPQKEKTQETIKEKPEQKSIKEKPEQKSTTPKIDSFMKFKAPNDKSPKTPKNAAKQKTPVKIDVLEEVAMPSWSDNSNDVVKPKESMMEVDQSEVTVIEDSEDIKLVYEESVGPESTDKPQSPKESSISSSASESSFLKQAKVTDVKDPLPTPVVPSPKAPRRVNFVTLSSPKNKKKK